MTPAEAALISRLFARTSIDEHHGPALAAAVGAAVYDGDVEPLQNLVRTEQTAVVAELQEITATAIGG